MSDPINAALAAAKTEAASLAGQASGTARSWLRRNVWGLLGVAATAVAIALLALLLR